MTIDIQIEPRAARLVVEPVFGRDIVLPLDVENIAARAGGVEVDPSVLERLHEARAVIDSVLERGEPAYGVNRGLGPLRDHVVPDELQHEFQLFVIASHDAAVGAPLSPVEVRAIMLARLAVMAQGNSGATITLFEGLHALLENDINPAIPEEGSVGAADLAALASVGAVLVGRGRVLGSEEPVPGADALHAKGLKPLTLAAKDALALVGANAASVGLACLASARLDRFTAMADLVAAHSMEAMVSNVNVLSEQVVQARPHPGQIRVAKRIRSLLDGGHLAGGLIGPQSLQDPLSFRTIPQVHGVLLEHADLVREIVTIELNSRPENPYIDVQTNSIISNGNFSTLRMGLAFDTARLAVAHICMLSERRISSMIGRLRSGRSLMEQIAATDEAGAPLVPVILANTASSLVARVQHLAAPVSHLGTGVGDGSEDHNAQAYTAARLLQQSLAYAETVVAIEVLVATGVSDSIPHTNKHVRGFLTEDVHVQTRAAFAVRSSSESTAIRIERVRCQLREIARRMPEV